MSFEGSRFRFKKMFDLRDGTVVDAIPAEKRDDYLLRGTSLGALALNLLHGVNRVNPRDDLYMHVFDFRGEGAYIGARTFAEALARYGTFEGHFSGAELAQLGRLARRPDLRTTPGIVLGFARDAYETVLHPETGAPAINVEVPLSGIDPYSQAEISKLFGTDVSKLPPTPGATRPVSEV